MTAAVGIYVRISEDRADAGAGVSRQETDCRALAERHGWDVAGVYRENDTSAFKRRRVTLPDGTTGLRVVRPEFRRALDDLAAGRIGGLVSYDLDRIARDPRDLEDLIDVAEHTGHPVKSVTGSLDLSSGAGITMARVAVAVANQSSRDTSRRVRRAKEESARAGTWSGGGRRAYGYTSARDAVVTVEADVVARIAQHVLAGSSLHAIAACLNADRIPTVSGSPWNVRSVRSVVTKPAVAGKRVHHGQVVGDATWPAILDEVTWTRVCDELSARTPRATGALRHWLTGLLVCGLCGENLRANGDRYWCGSTTSRGMAGCGRISIAAAPTELLVERLLLERWAKQRKVPATSVRSAAPDDAQLVELAGLWGRQEISLAEYRAARAAVLARLAVPAAPSMPAWVDVDDIAGQWPGLAPGQKRRLASWALEGVVVRPSPTRRWSEERVEVQWR